MGKQNKKAKKRLTDEQFLRIESRLVLGIGAVVVCIGIFTYILHVDKYYLNIIDYYTTWVKCGQRPVNLNNFGEEKEYSKFGDYDYHAGGLLQDYVCTEDEAIQKNYKYKPNVYFNN